MEENHACCCGESKQDAEAANRKCLSRLVVVFKWVARLAAVYYLFMVVMQWVIYFSHPEMPNQGFGWGIVNSLAQLLIGAVAWFVFTGFSLVIERLLMMSQCCGEEK